MKHTQEVGLGGHTVPLPHPNRIEPDYVVEVINLSTGDVFAATPGTPTTISSGNTRCFTFDGAQWVIGEESPNAPRNDR